MDRWPRHLGRDTGRGPGRHLADPQGRRQRPGDHGCGGARAAGRAGHRPDRELLQQGTVRRPDEPAVGPGDPARLPPARVHGLRLLPADVPVRADLGRGAGRGPGLARPSPEDLRARPVRAVRGGLFRVPDLRGVAPGGLVEVLPRPAAEHVRGLRPHRRGSGLVRAHPAPGPPRGGGRADGARAGGGRCAAQPGRRHRRGRGPHRGHRARRSRRGRTGRRSVRDGPGRRGRQLPRPRTPPLRAGSSRPSAARTPPTDGAGVLRRGTAPRPGRAPGSRSRRPAARGYAEIPAGLAAACPARARHQAWPCSGSM